MSFFQVSAFHNLYTLLPPLTLDRYEPKAISFLISAIAFPGLRPLGQARVQLRIVWQRYRLIEFSSLVLRSALRSSRESASQR